MTLHDLMTRLSWNDVKSSLLSNYPDALRSLSGFEAAFSRILNLSPRHSIMRICFQCSAQGCVKVFGRNGNPRRDYLASTEESDQEECFELSLAAWDAWSGMEIDHQTLHGYTVAEIVSHCLHEMTFFGFDENSAANGRAEILRAIAELESRTGPERVKFLHEIVRTEGVKGDPERSDTATV